MLRSQVRNLIFSLLCLSLLSSCSPSLFNNFRRSPAATEFPVESCSWFNTSDESLLYKASVNAWKNNYSGMMLIKPFGEDSYRTLFITEMGIKIFDMEIGSDGNQKMHYCLDELNRKSVTKLLGNDLGMMLFPLPVNGSNKVMQDGRDGVTVLKMKDKRGTRYAYIADGTGKISRLILTGGLFKKFSIRYSGTDGGPENINISHNFLKLNINLSILNEISE